MSYKYDPYRDRFTHIDDKPIIKMVPIKIGHWLPYEFGDYHWHKCSVCGKADKYIETIDNRGDLQAIRNFCPLCGARMDLNEVEKMNALDKLRKMLNEAKIPYESYQEEWSDKWQYAWDKSEGAQWQRNQIIYGRYGEHDWKLDAIFQYGSWGREDNCVETYGDLGVDEDGNPRVMSAEEVFAIIKKDWDKKNEVKE